MTEDPAMNAAQAEEFIRMYPKMLPQSRQHLLTSFAKFLTSIIPPNPSVQEANDWSAKWLGHQYMHEEMLEQMLDQDEKMVIAWMPIYRHWSEDDIYRLLMMHDFADRWMGNPTSQVLCQMTNFKSQYKNKVIQWVLERHRISDDDHEYVTEKLFKDRYPSNTARLMKWWNDDLNIHPQIIGDMVEFCLSSGRPHLHEVARQTLLLFKKEHNQQHPWNGTHVIDIVQISSMNYNIPLLNIWEEAFGKTPDLRQDTIMLRAFFGGAMEWIGRRYREDDGFLDAKDQTTLQNLQQLFQHWYGDRSRRQSLLTHIAPQVSTFALTQFLHPILDVEDLVFLAQQDLPSSMVNHPLLQQAVLHSLMPSKPDTAARKM